MKTMPSAPEDSYVDHVSEGKGGEAAKKIVESTIVDRVQEYFYTDEDFSDFFEEWCRNNCDIIDPDVDECRLEYTSLYKEFLRVFEDKITDFIEANGSTVESFYDCLRCAEKNSNYDIFGQILNATIDFDVFLQMMRETAIQEQREKK